MGWRMAVNSFVLVVPGFDAHVSFKFTEQGTRGLWTYLKVIVREYWKYEPLVYTIVQNGEERKEKAFVVTFANACQYGNDGFIAPQASTSDGLLDISVIHPFHFWSVPVWHLTCLRSGSTTIRMFLSPERPRPVSSVPTRVHSILMETR